MNAADWGANAPGARGREVVVIYGGGGRTDRLWPVSLEAFYLVSQLRPGPRVRWVPRRYAWGVPGDPVVNGNNGAVVLPAPETGRGAGVLEAGAGPVSGRRSLGRSP